MDFQYISPELPRRLDGWRSAALGIDMPVVVYGDRGHPLLLFPTAAADYLECERFFLIQAIESQILAGRIQVLSIDSINSMAWMDDKVPVPEQARRQALYMTYVEAEVAPYIRQVSGDPEARAFTSGASFGAFHAANALFRRPDLFGGTIAMSGFYDLAPSYLRGYRDDNCYFNNPATYLPRLEGRYLELLQRSCQIVIVSGQGAYEEPQASQKLSRILTEKAIPHQLDLWGADVNHDWPWWRRMLPYFVDRMESRG